MGLDNVIIKFKYISKSQKYLWKEADIKIHYEAVWCWLRYTYSTKDKGKNKLQCIQSS